MLVNEKANRETHVEFVSYTGEYPCLCSGIPTLKIDGKEYRIAKKYGLIKENKHKVKFYFETFEEENNG